MTGEGVEAADDKEELADMFSSANSIRSSKISSDSPVKNQNMFLGLHNVVNINFCSIIPITNLTLKA